MKKVKIVFREKRKRYEIEESSGYKSYGYKPTGILCFKMVVFYKDTEWKDGKLPLEEQLSIIVSTMEVKAREHKQEMLRWKIEREKQEEELRTIRAQEERIEKELAAFKRLLDNAQEWHRVEVAREYIEKVEKMLLAKSCASDDTKKWLSWARCMLDLYDPLNNDLNFIFSR